MSLTYRGVLTSSTCGIRCALCFHRFLEAVATNPLRASHLKTLTETCGSYDAFTEFGHVNTLRLLSELNADLHAAESYGPRIS